MAKLTSFPDVWVTLQPERAYAKLALVPAGEGLWLLLRRPLLLTGVLVCAVSLMTSGRLTLRLAPAAIYWIFVPAVEIASLAIVSGKRWRGRSFSRTVDLFFMSHVAWSLWLTGYAAVWAFVPAIDVFSWSNAFRIWNACAIVAALWSAYMDFWFYRRVLQDNSVQAARDLLLQRLICWSGLLVCFVAPAGWQEVATRLGL